jgi:hypothetical protein
LRDRLERSLFIFSGRRSLVLNSALTISKSRLIKRSLTPSRNWAIS